MIKIIRIVSLFLWVLLSACTTTSSSFTTPYATKDSTNVGSDYDLEKAAATRLTLGLRYLSQGDFEKAKFNLDKALAHYPNSEEVQRGVAWYYEQVNEDKVAEEHYRTALSINNKNSSLLNQYGVFLCRKGRLEESLKMFHSSINIPSNKDVSSTYENAATCNIMAGNIETAESYYRKALNHNPEQRDSLLGMARIEYSKGRNKRTRAYLSRYEEVAKHNSRSLWLSLRNESKLGNMDGAASYAIKLEQLFPDSNETALFLDTKDQWLK